MPETSIKTLENNIEEIADIGLEIFGQMVKHTVKASELSDGELIDEVCLKIDLDISTYESALLDELTLRFQRFIGLEETPKGISNVAQ